MGMILRSLQYVLPICRVVVIMLEKHRTTMDNTWNPCKKCGWSFQTGGNFSQELGAAFRFSLAGLDDRVVQTTFLW